MGSILDRSGAASITRYSLGDRQGAIADYDRAVQISPSNAEVYGNLGIARYKVGDKIDALRDLQKAADLFKNQGKDEDYQKAMQIFQKLGG
jgi:Flp pilus assembly protein TadD